MKRYVPCLIVRQPYASLIAFGKKRWEFRSYSTRKRGDILIAASRGKPIETSDETLNGAAKSFPRGVLLASARLTQSKLVTAFEIKKIGKNAVKTRIGDLEFLTADAPVGEPLVDLQALSPKWCCYAWHLDDVKSFSEPIPLDQRPCSPWTRVAIE